MKLTLGTRGSALARAQASEVARRLVAAGHRVETVVISTLGDRAATEPFADVGAFGIFVREIEAALIAGEIDIAVHSYKDIPSTSPQRLIIASVPERLDPADLLLISRDAIDENAAHFPLRDGVRVGTSAARRTAWLRAARPDLVTLPLRGNVPTRITALREGTYDAIVLAAAGIARLQRITGSDRLELPPEITVLRLDPTRFVPAPSQGAIALQVRADRSAVIAAAGAINDTTTARALRAEREALRLAEGGCTLPFGAWCSGIDGQLRLIVALGLADGTIARGARTGTDPDEIARAAWAEVRATAGIDGTETPDGSASVATPTAAAGRS